MKAPKLKNIALAAIAIVLFATVSMTNAQGKGMGNKGVNHGVNFVDANGDGICDNRDNPNVIRPKDGTGKKYGAGNGFGMKNGKGNGTGICNGTGQGSGNGTGICDGTGPKGKGRGGNK